MAALIKDGHLLVKDGQAKLGDDCTGCCSEPPGPQPCNENCQTCERGTRPKRMRLTMSGIVERAGYAAAHLTNEPKWKTGNSNDAIPACSIAGSDFFAGDLSDIYGCLALNRSLTFGCTADGDCDYALSSSSICAPSTNTNQWPSALCTLGATASHSVTIDWEAPNFFGTSLNRPAVRIGWALPYEDDFTVPGTDCIDPPPAGETGPAAVFVGAEGPNYPTPFDCSAVGTVLSQYLTESTWCPCDFSGATVTLEIIEYQYVIPETLYLSISGTCLDDDAVDPIPLIYDSVNNRYEGAIECGATTLNVWYYCSDEPNSPTQTCLDDNHADAQGEWTLMIFDGATPDDSVACFHGTSGGNVERSTTQNPFLWEAVDTNSAISDGCCECVFGGGDITFTVSE